MAKSGIAWTTRPAVINRNLGTYGARMTVGVQQFASDLAALAEAEAKRNAPWKDQTGEARRQLRAVADNPRPGVARVTLSHGVPYGIYLEVRRAGRWSIIMPTLERLAPEWASWLRRLGF